MNTSTATERHTGQVNNKVTNLAEEVVLIRKPVDSSILVRIGVNNSHAREAGSGLKSWGVDSIANHMSVIVLLQWRADHVNTWGEIYQCWCNGCRITTLSTASAGSDGIVDGDRVVSRAIALGTEVLDIAINLEVRVTIGDLALARDSGEPVAGLSGGEVLGSSRSGRDQEEKAEQP